MNESPKKAESESPDKTNILDKSFCSSLDTTNSSFYIIKKKNVNFFPLVDVHFIQSYKLFYRYGIMDYEKREEERRNQMVKKLDDDYYGESSSYSKCCTCTIF